MDDEGTEAEGREAEAKTDQQIFDEQVARMSGRVVVIFGGLGILAALVMSTVALVIASNNNTTTVSVPAAAAPTRTSTTPKNIDARLNGDALGAQLFASGNPATGAIGCASCHTMKAAGATGTIGPNLDKELGGDPAAATLESIVDPNKEIIPGYSANVMPTNYRTALSKQQLAALTKYIYDNTNTKAIAKNKRP